MRLDTKIQNYPNQYIYTYQPSQKNNNTITDNDNKNLNLPKFLSKEDIEKTNKLVFKTILFFEGSGLMAFLSLKTGVGLKYLNKMYKLTDKLLDYIPKKNIKNLNIENISPKTILHVFTSCDNPEGIKNKIKGAHTVSALVKSFYSKKLTVKEGIEIKKISMKNKEKDGNIIIKYVENGVTKEFETNIGEGFTKEQQKMLLELKCIKQLLKQPAKPKFIKNYLTEETAVSKSKSNFSKLEKKFFEHKLTGQINSITPDPLFDGVYNINYQKFGSKSKFPDKTIFVQKNLSEKELEELKKICSPEVLKNTNWENLAKNTCDIDNMVKTAQKALEQGVVVDNNGTQMLIGSKEGILIAAYFKKTPQNSYEITSFFPISHGSSMHNSLMQKYLEKQKAVNGNLIPLLIGLKEKIQDSTYMEAISKKIIKIGPVTSATVGLADSAYNCINNNINS